MSDITASDVTPSDATASDGTATTSTAAKVGPASGIGTPVSIGRLDPKPDSSGPKRVLGVVPGKPIAGERKVPAEDDMVMVWPHLLVRHAVAALSTIVLVLVTAYVVPPTTNWVTAASSASFTGS